MGDFSLIRSMGAKLFLDVDGFMAGSKKAQQESKALKEEITRQSIAIANAISVVDRYGMSISKSWGAQKNMVAAAREAQAILFAQKEKEIAFMRVKADQMAAIQKRYMENLNKSLMSAAVFERNAASIGGSSAGETGGGLAGIASTYRLIRGGAGIFGAIQAQHMVRGFADDMENAAKAGDDFNVTLNRMLERIPILGAAWSASRLFEIDDKMSEAAKWASKQKRDAEILAGQASFDQFDTGLQQQMQATGMLEKQDAERMAILQERERLLAEAKKIRDTYFLSSSEYDQRAAVIEDLISKKLSDVDARDAAEQADAIAESIKRLEEQAKQAKEAWKPFNDELERYLRSFEMADFNSAAKGIAASEKRDADYRKRAADLVDGSRSALERFRGSEQEWRQMLDDNLISKDTFDRLRGTALRALGLGKLSDIALPTAVQGGTAAAFDAINRAANPKTEKTWDDILKEDREQTRQLQELNKKAPLRVTTI